MADDSSKFVPPVLTKKEPTRPLLVWCDTCDRAVRPDTDLSRHGSGGRYMLYEGGPGEPPMVFEVHCHGEVACIGIEDVAGFNEVLAKHRAPKEFTTQQTGEWWHWFPKPEAAASGASYDPTTL